MTTWTLYRDLLQPITNELITQIREEKIDYKKIDDFVHYFFDDLDGKASERFVDYLINDFYEEDKTEEAVDSRYTADGKFNSSLGRIHKQKETKNKNRRNRLR